jgi:hypothetical protein
VQHSSSPSSHAALPITSSVPSTEQPHRVMAWIEIVSL